MAIEAGDYGGDEDEDETAARAEATTTIAIATTTKINYGGYRIFCRLCIVERGRAGWGSTYAGCLVGRVLGSGS
jgi:hypothetical protein